YLLLQVPFLFSLNYLMLSKNTVNLRIASFSSILIINGMIIHHLIQLIIEIWNFPDFLEQFLVDGNFDVACHRKLIVGLRVVDDEHNRFIPPMFVQFLS